jgi:hypothetical protein
LLTIRAAAARRSHLSSFPRARLESRHELSIDGYQLAQQRAYAAADAAAALADFSAARSSHKPADVDDSGYREGKTR